MLKLIKYEMRKNVTAFVTLYGILIGLETVFVLGCYLDNTDLIVMAIGCLVATSLTCYYIFYIFGISSYSKELKTKTGYLTFMIPVSSHQILWSKLLSTIIASTVYMALVVGFGFVDMAIMENKYSETKLMESVLEMVLEKADMSVAEVGMAMLVYIVAMIIEFLSIVGIAYLAMTLSATLFQNNKGKSVLSFVLFVVFIYAMGWLMEVIPDLSISSEGLYAPFIEKIPTFGANIVILIVTVFASAKLLDKKVSL